MAETFTYVPSYASGVDGSFNPKILSSKFGDGYEQRIADGINSISGTWNLQFVYDNTTADAIESFFRTAGGHAWFWWTPSGESTAKKFVCKTWGKTRTGRNVSTVKATFEEVFDYGS